ncbi:MAG TPA: hypothetical protein ENH07_10345 [Nitrospirae bacterium]|nr:hypothetical protein [Nitrospirota bacterium]
MTTSAAPSLLPPDTFAANIAAHVPVDDLLSYFAESKYEQYQDDPVGFCEDILGESLTDDVIAMMNSVRDHQVTVAISGNGTGKSWGAGRVSVWFYLCHPDTKVFTAAAPPLDNLKNILWGEIGSVIAKHPGLFENHIKTSLDIRRGPEDFLTGVTIPSSGTAEERESKFSGKHQKHLLFVLDEGDAIPDDVYRGIESCMSGGVKIRLLIMFNPRQASGAVFRMIRDHEAHVVHLSAFNHPNVITGDNVIPGAVDRDTTVRRINIWTRPANPQEQIPSESRFTLPDCLVGVQAPRQSGGLYPPLKAGEYKIANPAFSYMVLGQYPAQAIDQLISMDWISQARSRYDIYVIEHGEVPPQYSEGIMGLDCAEMGDDLNVAVARYGGYLSGFETWGGVDPIVTGSKGVDFYNRGVNITSAYVDATGVGAGVAPHMQRADCVAVGVKVAASPTFETEEGEFRKLRDQLWWSLREWIRTDNAAMIPPDEELIEELTTANYEIKEGKIVVMSQNDMKEILGRSPNKADAIRMTFAGDLGGFFDGLTFEDYPMEEEWTA